MVDVRPEPIATLDRHAETSIRFEVSTVFDITLIDGGLGGVLLGEHTLDAPWEKDYDTADGGPSRWASRFDVSSWGMFGALSLQAPVGPELAAPCSLPRRSGRGSEVAAHWRSKRNRSTSLPAASTSGWDALSLHWIASPTPNFLTRRS